MRCCMKLELIRKVVMVVVTVVGVIEEVRK